MVLFMNGVGWEINIHDRTLSFSAAVSQQLLGQFKWNVFDHLAYSPNLAQCDFYICPDLKNWLGGENLQTQQCSGPSHITGGNILHEGD